MVLLHVAVTSAYVNPAQALGATPLRVAADHGASATVELLPAKLVLTARFAVLTEATPSPDNLTPRCDPPKEDWLVNVRAHRIDARLVALHSPGRVGRARLHSSAQDASPAWR